MYPEELKEKVAQAIDAHRDEIIAIGDTIFNNPELGFKERKTEAIIASYFSRLGISYRDKLAITGIRADLHGCNAGPTVAILGEMDALICPEAAGSDPETGAAHVCGHSAQIAALLGAARGLITAGVLEQLSGNIALLAVPAEEMVEIAYRKELVRKGLIQFLGGKQECIRLGVLDDIDIAMMIHGCTRPCVAISKASNGFIAKSIRYIGREAHASSAPHQGINALNAANLGLMGIHSLRETFRDEDHIRIHWIMTQGGDQVNVVPAETSLEMFVRGASLQAIDEASGRVNRALQAGAMAIGAQVEIEEIPGYLPLYQDDSLLEVFIANARNVFDGEIVIEAGFPASTDMGDVSHIIPSIAPSVGGFSGMLHQRTLRVDDPELAYIVPAKLLAFTAIDLLAEEAARAKEIKARFKPRLTKEEYLEFWQRFTQMNIAKTEGKNGKERLS